MTNDQEIPNSNIQRGSKLRTPKDGRAVLGFVLLAGTVCAVFGEILYAANATASTPVVALPGDVTLLPPAEAGQATSFWSGLEHVALLLTIAGLAVTLSRKKERRKIEPDPLRVRKVEKEATEEDCARRHRDAMKAVETLRAENKEERERIYDQIGTVERRGEDKLAHAVQEFNQTLRNMPSTIIKLLRDTGNLK